MGQKLYHIDTHTNITGTYDIWDTERQKEGGGQIHLAVNQSKQTVKKKDTKNVTRISECVCVCVLLDMEEHSINISSPFSVL